MSSATGLSPTSSRHTSAPVLARGLRVGGPYTITTTKDGKTETREGVYLELAETGNVDIKFSDATTLAAVQVTGTRAADIFDSKKMGAGTNISAAQIKGFASIQRNLQDYARLDPRLTQSDKSRGEISAAGQNSRYNTITIDGVNTSDSFGLESNNLPTAKQPISIDAIKAVQVNVSNYDVTQKGYTGANINAVTKSGTNEFKGSLTYVYRNDGFFGDGVNGAPFIAFNDEVTYGVTLGGPILEDRLFFFAGYEEFTRSENAPDFGPLGSSASNIVNISQSQIDAITGIANTTWAFNAGTSKVPAGIETKVKDSLVKIDWNINDNHRASYRYNKTEQNDLVVPGFNSSRLSLSSNWYTQGKTFESHVAQLFSDWSDNFSTEFKVSRRDYESIPQNFSNLPAISVLIQNPDPANALLRQTRTLLFGTDQFRHANELITRTDNIYLGANWFLGDHELKFGIDYDSNDISNLFLNDSNGVYTFSCINTSGTTFTYTFATVLNCTTATIAQVNQAANENFSRGRYSAYSLRSATDPVTGLPVSRDGAIAAWTLENTGLFLQDTWSVNSNLTVTAGLRYDRPNIDDNPIRNTAFETAFGRRNDVTIDGIGLLQPRVGFNYTFDGDKSMQLRGGVGLFQGSSANVWLTNPFTNNGLTIRTFSCSGTGANACPPRYQVDPSDIFNPNPANQPTFGPGTAISDVDLIRPDLEQPSVWKANIAFETELPFWGLVGQAELILTDTNVGIAYEHLNLGAPTRTAPDGRQMFWNASGYNAACWTGTGALSATPITCTGANSVTARSGRNTAFGDVVLAKPTGRGGSEVLTVGISRPMKDDWSWSLAYNFTQAEEVSPLTSSRAISNWDGRATFNPNEERAVKANYEIRDRFIGSFNYAHSFFGDYKTTVGLVYEGRAGRPFSWTYINDLNGDRIDGNDLMYIPTAINSGEVCFRSSASTAGSAVCVNDAAAEADFWAVVNANQELSSARGGVVDPNTGNNPWVNTFDFRISQEIPGFFKGNKATITLDVMNIGNLINKDWGLIDEITFNGGSSSLISGNNVRGGFASSFVRYAGIDSTGRYIYSVGSEENLSRRDNFGQSRWAAQVTLKYEF